MEYRSLETLLADDAARRLLEESLMEIARQDELLSALLAQCDARDSRGDGIPTLIVLEDFFAQSQPVRSPAAGDEGMGVLYALWLTALAAKVECDRPDTTWPAVCPAMSALAEKFFRIAPYQDVREEKL